MLIAAPLTSAMQTTSRASYRPDGKVGAELLENTGLGAAEEIKFERRGVPKEALFGHYPAMTEQVRFGMAGGDEAGRKMRVARRRTIWWPEHSHCTRSSQTKSFVSCHDLHYAEPHIGKPRAQAGLWAYSTSHNVKVPMSRPENIAGGTLALTRTRTLDRSEPYDPFLTTSQATLGATAHAITDGGAERRAPIVQVIPT